MDKKTIIAVIGKTSSGKDTVAKVLNEKYRISSVVSMTTRPKREYETNGVEHVFISKEEMSNVLKEKTIIAYTKNNKTGIEYCAALEALPSNICVYIINSDGVKWSKEHNKHNLFNLICVYVDLAEDEIIKRGLLRGDNPDTLRIRLESEREEFDAYKNSKEYDFLITNDKDLQYLYHQVDLFYSKYF